jgi:hypothetical protein
MFVVNVWKAFVIVIEDSANDPPVLIRKVAVPLG